MSRRTGSGRSIPIASRRRSRKFPAPSELQSRKPRRSGHRLIYPLRRIAWSRDDTSHEERAIQSVASIKLTTESFAEDDHSQFLAASVKCRQSWERSIRAIRRAVAMAEQLGNTFRNVVAAPLVAGVLCAGVAHSVAPAQGG